MTQDIKDQVASLDIGNQVRRLRNQRELTLRELSEMTGLSKPNLSQIENNIVTPPVSTLLKIATALGVPIGHFFQNVSQGGNIVVVRGKDRYGIAKGPHISTIGYQYEPLAYPRVEKNMEPFIVHVEERETEAMVYNNHRGEEFLFLLEGTLEFNCGDTTVTLEKGDSLYFDSSMPHAYRGLAGPAKALVIIHRPK